jgi:hypothetical protein
MEELPAFQCVHRGLDVIARQAAFLRYNYTLPPPLIKVISDAIDRDVDTSRSLLQGLRLPDFPVVADVLRSFHAPLLAPCVTQSSFCSARYLIPPERESARAMRWNDRNSLKRLAEAPVPPLHRQLLCALQAKLGCDITPVFPDIADSANMSTLVGGSAAAAALKLQLVQCSTCLAPT